MINPSKKAIRRAVNSEHGDRLVEIAQEHLRLARLALDCRDHVDRAVIDAAIDARIDALRKERDEILAKFAGDSDA